MAAEAPPVGDQMVPANDQLPAASPAAPEEPDPTDSGPGRWGTAASGEGAALFLNGNGDRRRLTLFCPSGPEGLLVNVPGFRPIASEERMSFGGGGTVVTLVADFRGDDLRGGVSGSGPVPAELAEILAAEEGLSVNYGAQNSGPHAPPSPELARNFVAACRG